MSCAPLLYTWLISHMPQEGLFTVEDLKLPQMLTSLTFSFVMWYIWDWEVEDIILSCGNFSNVLLIGSRGYIDYNVVLSMRKLRYQIERPPEDQLVKDFILHDMGEEDQVMLRRIRISWKRINWKGKEPGKRNCMAKESYCQWVKEKVNESSYPSILKSLFHPKYMILHTFL